MSLDPCDSACFRRACSRFPTGVTVTTLLGANGEPYGVTLSSFTSVSLDPPLVLVCIDNRSQMLAHMSKEQRFGISVLSEDQQEISSRFACKTEGRFTNVKWYTGISGVPLLCDAPAVFECVVTEMVRAGDHMIVIGRVLHASSLDRQPLAYINSHYAKIADGNPRSADHACQPAADWTVGQVRKT